MKQRHYFGKVSTISGQIVRTFSILLTLIMTCIILAVSVLFSRSLADEKTKIMQSTIEIVSSSVDTRINNLRQLAQSLRRSDDIIYALSNKQMSERAQDELDSLYAYGLQSVILITTDKELLNMPLSFSNEDQKILEMIGNNRFYDSNREELFSTPHVFPYETSVLPDNNTKLSYFYTLRNQNNMDSFGYVQLIINKDSLFSDRVSLIESQFDHYYVIDGSGKIIYSFTGYDSNDIMDNAVQISKNRYSCFHTQINSNVYLHYSVSGYPDWHLVGVTSNRSIYASTRLLILLVIVLEFIGILMVVLLSRMISRRITDPFQQMLLSMKQFELGKEPAKLAEKDRGEIGELMHGFNNMLDSIRAGIDTIYKEQKEKETAKVAALQYQLESLQQQINPHFLYNTLNVISYLAMEKRTDEIRSFVQSLNQLLRATLSNTNDTVTFRQEMNLLKSYVNLMEYRYKDLCVMEYEVDDCVLDCMVPKLILQPIVENAFLHGIFPSGKKGTIIIRGCCIDGRLWVSVSDNGIGIPEQEIQKMLQKKRGFSGIGLPNINDRIKLCYNDSRGLRINSKPGTGTIVAFEIPVQFDEEGEEE